MTATHVTRTSEAVHARPRQGNVAVVAAVAGGVTLLIRLALHTRSFDLFGDEVVYTDLGRSVIVRRISAVRGWAVFPSRARLLLPRSGLGAAGGQSAWLDGLGL